MVPSRPPRPIFPPEAGDSASPPTSCSVVGTATAQVHVDRTQTMPRTRPIRAVAQAAFIPTPRARPVDAGGDGHVPDKPSVIGNPQPTQNIQPTAFVPRLPQISAARTSPAVLSTPAGGVTKTITPIRPNSTPARTSVPSKQTIRPAVVTPNGSTQPRPALPQLRQVTPSPMKPPVVQRPSVVQSCRSVPLTPNNPAGQVVVRSPLPATSVSATPAIRHNLPTTTSVSSIARAPFAAPPRTVGPQTIRVASPMPSSVPQAIRSNLTTVQVVRSVMTPSVAGRVGTIPESRVVRPSPVIQVRPAGTQGQPIPPRPPAIPQVPSVTQTVPPAVQTVASAQVAFSAGQVTSASQVTPTTQSIPLQPTASRGTPRIIRPMVRPPQPVRVPVSTSQAVRAPIGPALACVPVSTPQAVRVSAAVHRDALVPVSAPQATRPLPCVLQASRAVVSGPQGPVQGSVASVVPITSPSAVHTALPVSQPRAAVVPPAARLLRASVPPPMRGAPPKATVIRVPVPRLPTNVVSPSSVRVAVPTPELRKSAMLSGVPVKPMTRGPTYAISQDDMIETIQRAFGDTPPAVPKRATAGTLGRKIDLVSNLFRVRLPRGNVFHYDVEIRAEGATAEEPVPSTPKARCASTLINRRVIEAISRAFPKEMDNCLLAFDGRKNVYTRRLLPNSELVLCTEIDDNGVQRTFQACFRYAATISLDPIWEMYEGKAKPDLFQDAIQAADVILRTGPTLRFVPVGRSFFTPPKREDGANKLGGGRELWFGFYTSIRLGVWQPLVNVDMSATAFYSPGPLVDLVQETLDPCSPRRYPNLLHSGLNEKQRISVLREIRTLKVRVTHFDSRRQHRIENVTRRSAKEETFNWDGRQITVADYFAEKYQYKLKYPALPCVQVGKKGTMLPIECCVLLPGQHCRRKLSDSQTTNMIKQTAVVPKDRFERLQEATKTLAQSASNHCSEFGMKLDPAPVTVEGRVLDALEIRYGPRERSIKVAQGVWKLEAQFVKAANMSVWAVAVLGDVKRERVDSVVQQFQREGGRLGMQVAPPALIANYGPEARPQKVLEDVKNRVPNVEITLIMLSKFSDYGLIKATAETSDLCMRTQCVKSVNINNDRKFNGIFTQNLLQKINTKLGGINHEILSPEPRAFSRPFMVVGIDVNHSGPGDTGTPSVASIVASVDRYPAQYYAITQVQVNKDGNRIECVIGLKEMFLECLHKFHERNKLVPERIFIYRDGVSEAQFDAVRAYELAAMRAACTAFEKSFTPSMVLIVVQKRHHVRFMPKNQREGVGRSLNIPPGTVVDTKIVHPGMFDFYICSHHGIQGTSRPTHYHVVHDDAGHSPDEIYQISYRLCHMYARCTRAVSLPAPAYYAHLVAFRAKEYIKGVIYGGAASSAGSDHGDSSSSSSDDIDLEKFTGAVKVNEKMRGMMYFV